MVIRNNSCFYVFGIEFPEDLEFTIHSIAKRAPQRAGWEEIPDLIARNGLRKPLGPLVKCANIPSANERNGAGNALVTIPALMCSNHRLASPMSIVGMVTRVATRLSKTRLFVTTIP